MKCNLRKSLSHFMFMIALSFRMKRVQVVVHMDDGWSVDAKVVMHIDRHVQSTCHFITYVISNWFKRHYLFIVQSRLRLTTHVVYRSSSDFCSLLDDEFCGLNLDCVYLTQNSQTAYQI